MCGGTRPRSHASPRVDMCWTCNQHGWVYPRVCGGTTMRKPRSQPPCSGLSPRVRGNRPMSYRSIPACAGEPSAGHRDLRREGLSPRVRGNPQQTAIIGRLAPTVYPRVCGGTAQAARIPEAAEVYPRVCGGTSCTRHAMPTLCEGLSPRVRGNPPQGLRSRA